MDLDSVKKEKQIIEIKHCTELDIVLFNYYGDTENIQRMLEDQWDNLGR